MYHDQKTHTGVGVAYVFKGVFIISAFMLTYCSLHAETSDAPASATVADQTGTEAKNVEKTYDLSALPDDLRAKVEKYLEEEKKLNVEIERMDGMLKAASNPWAQQRATGMATKLNYELKQQRLLRREIIRDYRKLVKSGWEPPESMEFEKLLVNPDKKDKPADTKEG
ncbi:hypothetical protein [Rubellicoccus peritrichatus]|uniref:Uncharacterized protein n=1 Tax=Rubellicoccus peritrichatus TaxID=3080537 RepID=A0AAQ3LEP0_9BACT|nr:hypothetical protein [Puniceicoccus sp. CR14]WOO42238.1 hypothetical protein RZN69_03995 [Puniceicoccus sp. CR14]